MQHLTTEQCNTESAQLDQMSPLEIVRLMNREDHQVVEAVAQQADIIAETVEAIVERLREGGRLVYIGAGTSGRLGVLDASECPPTFNTRPEIVVGVIAGGLPALTSAIEGAEDNGDAAISDLERIGLGSRDVLIGIATSGRTPYVIAGLEHANHVGALPIGLCCNHGSELERVARWVITVVVGPEILSGSTRLKAGTATKMVLNMLTTASMVQLGKTYGHWMVDLRATNRKLKDRSIRIVAAITGLPQDDASNLLMRCDGEVKTAIVSHKLGVAPDQARLRLERTSGRLRESLSDTLGGLG
ncbi:MAG: N-acetylmuramic acid 6-phosphate etherase [Planctomycetes bacterium]|nr:N-acetylmuramic acid 6-phosphate etherase [Planctomycetota bacterium]